ncbi:hypothetical protein CXB49_11485 [Chromobacterium sp. ATCC 53434]|uniref:hypothetical protein n=1 Tax=Chromobacterium TaxID=535 RepID=UPI000C767C0A|nr:hypothetical protein [Chromobacterium sp. ATCC 53434]AUH51393.1 hypothetical protein CXB49_11485 [Chromobacterium sp. ATCC 53434]
MTPNRPRRPHRGPLLPALCAAAAWALAAHADFPYTKDQTSPVQTATRTPPVQHGAIDVAISQAHVYGLDSGGSHSYCSPSIKIINHSQDTLRTLILGIEYHRNGSRESSGSSVVNLNLPLEPDNYTTTYFNPLSVSSCKDLQGTVTVLSCQYAFNGDCEADVHAIGFGAIPLQRAAGKKP